MNRSAVPNFDAVYRVNGVELSAKNFMYKHHEQFGA